LDWFEPVQVVALVMDLVVDLGLDLGEDSVEAEVEAQALVLAVAGMALEVSSHHHCAHIHLPV